MALLNVNGLKKVYTTRLGGAKVTALSGVSFTVEEGEFVAIMGESGSGKSVTSYSVMGLTAHPGRLIGGSIEFNGHRIDQMSEKEMRRIRGNEVSIIFQDPMTSLNPVYTIGNQICEVIRLHTKKSKAEARARATELLTLVGINEPEKRLKQYPHELSGGMRQRVMIAIALACEPKLLIADEPTTALDVTIQAQILALMEDIRNKRNTGILMITHDLGVVAETCSRVIVMYAGNIVEEAPVKELFANPQHPYTQGLIESVPKLGSRVHRLPSIPGSVPDLAAMPSGCRFAPRCKYAQPSCSEKLPDLVQVGENHRCACPFHTNARKGA